MIPYGHQLISEEDIQAVIDVLRSDYLTQGPVVAQFEKAISNYTAANFSVAVNSGTSALHLACRALDLGPGDILWTTPITFVASANCALYCGAEVDFVDIDSATFNISVEALAEKLALAEKQNRLPKVIVPVHLCGLSCDMEAIAGLAKKYGFYVIEDASHALGSDYKDVPVGNCRYSDITVFSFHPVKSITTGEGGLATTNHKIYAEKMAMLRSHGITRDNKKMTKSPEGPWYYQQIDLGYNYRMTDIQAALGISQLNRLDQFVKRRNDIAAQYDELLKELPIRHQRRLVEQRSAMHLYVVCLDEGYIDKSHGRVIDELRERGIGVNVHYIPVHLQPWYENLGFKRGDFPEAERYYQRAISLPIYPSLQEEEINTVITSVCEVLR